MEGGPDGLKGPLDASAGMPFIVSSNAEKADPATRKLIRSHARRGGKQKRGYIGKPKRQGPARKGARDRYDQDGRVKLDEVGEMYVSLVPRRVGSDLSFVELPGDMEPSILLNMIKGQ